MPVWARNSHIRPVQALWVVPRHYRVCRYVKREGVPIVTKSHPNKRQNELNPEIVQRHNPVRIDFPKPMMPPWLAFPHIPRASIGWRMGDGEEYLCFFSQWFQEMSDGDKSAFAELYPEPDQWHRFYSMLGL